MRTACLALALVVLAPLESTATPQATAHHGAVPIREPQERQDQCHLRYYNFCSGWTWTWSGYCYGGFSPADYPTPMYGTCFDLQDCPSDCRHVQDVWFACWSEYCWGCIDVEIYCGDQANCPLGPPLAGIYGYRLCGFSAWRHFDFGGLPLCSCEDEADKFILMITDHTAGYYTEPYSDLNRRNIETGCETEWRCSGHSFVYQNLVSYCDVYGAPGALWRSAAGCGCSNYPPIPPGCHNYFGYSSGYYCEWLIDCYVGCLGATETEEGSWSHIKAMYR